MSRIDDFLEMLDGYEERGKFSNIPFNIAEFDGFYRADGIFCNNKFVSSDFAIEALPSKSHDEHVIHAASALDLEYKAASAPLVYAICNALYQNREGFHEKLVEKARKAIEDIIGLGKGDTIHTLSQVIYYPGGFFDVVTHNPKQKTKYFKELRLRGDEGYIKMPKINAEEFAQAILGTEDNAEKINAVFKWVTGKDSYALRNNFEPEGPLVSPVTLGVLSITPDFFINAVTDPLVKKFAFGVRPVQKKVAE